MPQYRYYANTHGQKKDIDPKTGEPIYWQMGEEIPAERFGSPQALRAAMHGGHVVAHAVATQQAAATPMDRLRAASAAEDDHAAGEAARRAAEVDRGREEATRTQATGVAPHATRSEPPAAQKKPAAKKKPAARKKPARTPAARQPVTPARSEPEPVETGSSVVTGTAELPFFRDPADDTHDHDQSGG